MRRLPIVLAFVFVSVATGCAADAEPEAPPVVADVAGSPDQAPALVDTGVAPTGWTGYWTWNATTKKWVWTWVWTPDTKVIVAS